MKLLTKEIREKLPNLYATENTPLEEKVVAVKFFTPWTNWTWYGVEFDGEDLLWGLVCGLEREWGYFSLRELQSVTGRGGLKIERDMYFKPAKIKDLNLM